MIIKLILFFLDGKFRRMFKEFFLLREVMKECCEDIKFLRKKNADKTDKTESTFLSTFHFPLQRRRIERSGRISSRKESFSIHCMFPVFFL